MKKIQTISLISLCFFLFLLPFSITIANVLLYIFMVGTVCNIESLKKIKTISDGEKKYIIFSVGYYIWCVISLLWTGDLDRGLQLVGRYIPIVFFPIFFSLAKADGIIKTPKLLYQFFIAGVLFSSVICLIWSYYDGCHGMKNGEYFNADYYNENVTFIESFSRGTNVFSYNFLSHFIHPSYFSLYILFAIICCVYVLIHSGIVQLYKRILLIVTIIYLSIFTFCLESRSGLLVFVFIAVLVVSYYLFLKKKYIVLIFLGGLFAVASVKIVPNTRLNGMIESVKKALERKDMQEHITTASETENERILIWKNAIRVIKRSPFFGVGIGDTDIELEKQYKEDNLDFDYGTHNQYLYAQLSMGIVSLLLLLAMLFVPLYYGIKNRYFPLIGFSLAVIINLLFENMLTRNAGLMFIPWAMIVLLMMSEGKKKVLENDKR